MYIISRCVASCAKESRRQNEAGEVPLNQAFCEANAECNAFSIPHPRVDVE